MPKTRVIITVDVEPSVAGAYAAPPKYAPRIHEPIWGEIDGRSEALGFLLRTLNEHELQATFFIEALHTNYFPRDLMGAYVAKILEAGQDAQLHLHPTWLNFRDGKATTGERVSDDCNRFAEDQLEEIIRSGLDTLQHWTGMRPTSMRNGNFSASMSVYRAMHRAGLEIASNICVSIVVPPEPELHVGGGIHSFARVRELPVTCFSDVGPVGRGRPRPLQVTALSLSEMTASLDQVHAKGGAVAVIVTHPFEFLKYNRFTYADLRRNELVQSRFRGLCAFLTGNRDRFEVLPLGDAAARLPASEPDVALTGAALRSVMRAAQNFINDRLL